MNHWSNAGAERPHINSDLLIKAAKEYGKAHGFRGNHGGWISDDSRTVCQGWLSFGLLWFRPIADHYTRKLTAFDSFDDFLNTSANYSPTILPRTWREAFLADAFDRAAFDRKQARRAWRGSNA
jgi:hypothetical protein